MLEKRMMTIRTDLLPDAPTLGQKRIFVITSRSVTECEQTIRHVVIFDNHPASLRLLSSSLKLPRRNKNFYVILAIALVLAAVLGMFWPFL
jgi:hypothetical protein